LAAENRNKTREFSVLQTNGSGGRLNKQTGHWASDDSIVNCSVHGVGVCAGRPPHSESELKKSK
jgi:hypothetical protein